MKNNKFLLAILVVLIAAALFFMFNQKVGTLGDREGVKSDFAFEDTTQIDKIFIADSEGRNVTLGKKEDGVWLVEGKHKARPGSISVLLKTFNRIAVKSPLSKAAHNNVVTELATKGIKVEIYEGKEKPSKIYYVGDPTNDHLGTYMLLETDGVKSTEPFVMHIPGFFGFLTTRFFADKDEWRDALVFGVGPEEIKKVELNYFETPEESFVIEKNMDEIRLYSSEKTIENFDSQKLNDYLNSFKKIYYENTLSNVPQEQQDSVAASAPFFSIKVTDIYGVENEMVAYHMPNFKQLLDNEGNPYPYNLDRMYGRFNNDLLVFIQFGTFDQLTLPLSHFLKP